MRWDGRLQRLGGRLRARLPRADVIVDGAHNPGAADAIASALKQIHNADPRPMVIVIAMLESKDHIGFCRPLFGLNARILTVPLPSQYEGHDQSVLADQIRTLGLAAEPCESLSHAIDQIADEYRGELSRVVFTGSLYFVGEVLAFDGTEVSC